MGVRDRTQACGVQDKRPARRPVDPASARKHLKALETAQRLGHAWVAVPSLAWRGLLSTGWPRAAVPHMAGETPRPKIQTKKNKKTSKKGFSEQTLALAERQGPREVCEELRGQQRVSGFRLRSRASLQGHAHCWARPRPLTSLARGRCGLYSSTDGMSPSAQPFLFILGTLEALSPPPLGAPACSPASAALSQPCHSSSLCAGNPRHAILAHTTRTCPGCLGPVHASPGNCCPRGGPLWIPQGRCWD